MNHTNTPAHEASALSAEEALQTTNKLAEAVPCSTDKRQQCSTYVECGVHGCQRLLGECDATRSADQATQPAEAVAWRSVAIHGLPPCDGQTVYLGENENGFLCTFTWVNPDGCCLQGLGDSLTAQFSGLQWWAEAPQRVPYCKTCRGSGEVPYEVLHGPYTIDEGMRNCDDCGGTGVIAHPAPASASEPTMEDAIAAGDGTLHGAIDYWQSRALAAEAARDADETNKVLADNYLQLTSASVAGAGEALAELVALKDMKDRLQRLHAMGHGTDYTDYNRRKPLAWAAARAALAPSGKLPASRIDFETREHPMQGLSAWLRYMARDWPQDADALRGWAADVDTALGLPASRVEGEPVALQIDFEDYWEKWPFQNHKNPQTKGAARHAWQAGKAVCLRLIDCPNCLGDGQDGDVDDYGRTVGFDCHQCGGRGKILAAPTPAPEGERKPASFGNDGPFKGVAQENS